MKYIDADELRAQIEALKEKYSHIVAPNEIQRCYKGGRLIGYNDALYKIDKLQQEQPDCHTVEDWIQHIKNADQLTKDIFSKGPYDVLYDALNHPYPHCYDAIKEFGELCFHAGVNSVKQGQPEVDLEKEIDEKWDEFVSSEGEREDFTNIARHFYELGLDAKKKDQLWK